MVYLETGGRGARFPHPAQGAIMDPGSVGVFIPIAAILAWGAVKIAKIQAAAHTAGSEPELLRRLEAVENELGAVRQELMEAQERLDFAERLLAQRRPDTLQAPK
jgi:hypothetical protein